MRKSYIAMVLLTPCCVLTWWYFIRAQYPVRTEHRQTVAGEISGHTNIRVFLQRSDGTEREVLSDMRDKNGPIDAALGKRVSGLAVLASSINFASHVEVLSVEKRVGTIRWEEEGTDKVIEGKLFLLTNHHLGVAIGDHYYEDWIQDGARVIQAELGNIPRH